MTKKVQETTTTKYRDAIEDEPGFAAGIAAIRSAGRDASGAEKGARRCGVLAQEGIAVGHEQVPVDRTAPGHGQIPVKDAHVAVKGFPRFQ